MAAFLLSGHRGALPGDGSPTIQQIADALAGAGLRSASLADIELAALRNALTESQGNRTHAARILGISVRTLQRKLKSLDRPMTRGQ